MKHVFALLSLLLVVAIACSSGSETDPTSAPSDGVSPTEAPSGSTSGGESSTPTPVPETAAAPTGAAKAVEGGTFLRLGVDPPTLDPHLNSDASSAVYAVEIFGGLMTIDQNLAIVGDLAESWDVSPDGTTTTFRLRPGASFHNGRPVTATDIKWSLERAVDPVTESYNASVFLNDIVGVSDRLTGLANNISGVQVINDQTLTITTDAPKAYFLSKLTYPVSFVLDRENVATGPSWIFEPNGTGPFKLTEYRPGEILRLTKFDDYHLEPAKLDEVEFLLSGGNSMLMYENNEIHVTGIGLSLLQGIQDPSNVLNSEVVLAPPQFDVDYFGFNTSEPPFDDIKVRQAFNYAIDRDTLATTLLQDLVVPAAGILPPGFPGYNPHPAGENPDPPKNPPLI
ncbi:MAG: hypothetical protein H8E48_11510 [Chloroflexi bacterium]|nr:hypothetical protein [Chloroflexota bacterium]